LYALTFCMMRSYEIAVDVKKMNKEYLMRMDCAAVCFFVVFMLKNRLGLSNVIFLL
jgi:hypothetical protein